MPELLLTLGGAIIGALFSWPISHWYYRRAAKEVPDWAKSTPTWAIPLIESLPAHPLTVEELGILYAKALEKIDPDPISGFRVCPNCSAGKERFLKKYPRRVSDPAHPRHWTAFMGPREFVIECGACGHVLKHMIEDDPTFI